jgi:hypothetical protein
MEARAIWLRFEVETNAIDYLVRAGEFIEQAQSNKKAWKWVILALHGALYGFAISACRGTDTDIVAPVTRRGHQRLISFDEALKKCQDAEWMGTMYHGYPLVLTDGQKDSIKRLKQTLRNNFEHYVPRGWSIEIHGMPTISMDVLDVIRFLAVETFRYQNLNLSQRRKIKSVVFQSKRTLKKSQLYRESL